MKNTKKIKILVYSLLSLITVSGFSIPALAGNVEKSGVLNSNSSACTIAGNANAFNKSYSCSNCKHYSKEGPNTWVIACQFDNVVIPKDSSIQLYEPRRQTIPYCFYGKHHANYSESISEVESNDNGVRMGKILLNCSGGKD